MKRRVLNTPSGLLTQLSPERSDIASKTLNTAWSLQLEGEDVILEDRSSFSYLTRGRQASKESGQMRDKGIDRMREKRKERPVDEDVDDDVDDNVDEDRDNNLNLEDEGISDTYDDDDDDDDVAEEENNAGATYARDCRRIYLKHGYRLLVPFDEKDVSDDSCKIKILSAERRTELLSELEHENDDNVISDAYRVKDRDGFITSDSSRAKLIIPVVLPTTRLDHADLFRFHVMARTRHGDWKYVPADYENSQLTFLLKGVKFFIAYAQPISEFINVSSSGFTFKSSKCEQIGVEIPQGAVDGNLRMRVKVRPVNLDRMNAYRDFDPRAINVIYALTDILYVRHTMDTVLQCEGSVMLPVDGVVSGLKIKCLTKTSGKYKMFDVDKDQTVKNGQVELPYNGDPKISYQVLCVRSGTSDDKIKHDAAYLNGQVDVCTIFFFLSSKNIARYLTVDIVDRSVEERVHWSRRERGFYEIKNSRLSGVRLGVKKRIRVDLGGNMQSAERTKNTIFTFVYNCVCKNNSIEFRTAKKLYDHNNSIVKVLFDDRKVHEIHFTYPGVGQKLEEINNSFVLTVYQRDRSSMYVRETLYSGCKSESSRSLQPKPKPKSEAERFLQLKSESELESDSESGPPATTKLIPKPRHISRSNSAPGSEAPISISDQRQSSDSKDASSVPVRDHPLLQDASLLMLGENLPPEDVNKLMTRADFKSHEIDGIRRNATAFFHDPNMKLLQKWRIQKKSFLELSDNSTLRCLEKDLKEIGRPDVAKILKRLRKKKPSRLLRKKDFVNL